MNKAKEKTTEERPVNRALKVLNKSLDSLQKEKEIAENDPDANVQVVCVSGSNVSGVMDIACAASKDWIIRAMASLIEDNDDWDDQLKEVALRVMLHKTGKED